jgi:hypothetical protein
MPFTTQPFTDIWVVGLHPVHHECEMRMMLGSAAHHRRQCSCFVPGSPESDSPGLSRREGALEAFEAFEALQNARLIKELDDAS